MALLGFQRALLALYTDESELQEFFLDKEILIVSHKLSEREARALRGLPEQRLRQFVRELRTKQKDIVRHWFARTSPEHSPVLLLHSYRKGSVLCYQTPEGLFGEFRVGNSIRALLACVARSHGTLNLWPLTHAYMSLSETERLGVRELFAVVRECVARRLIGRKLHLL